jgi:hypothetical protein
MYVIDTDDIYNEVQMWLFKRIPEKERRGLEARSAKERHGREETPDDFMRRIRSGVTGTRVDTHRVLRLFYDGAKPQKVMMDGHPVTVTVVEREIKRKPGEDYSDGIMTFGAPGRIHFSARNRAGQQAAIDFLTKVTADYDAARQSGAQLYIATKWGEWQRAQDIPTRPFASVILRTGVREKLSRDLQHFLEDEAAYVRLGIPWHRGYLLHGPPGTGKTSIAKVLAEHLGLDMYYMPLSDLRADTDLARLLSQVQARSVLLLEDIDIAAASKDREGVHASEERITLSGLLNALDGVVTPHGLIVMMTTNRIDTLDDALIRAGRADLHVHIDSLDDDQLSRLVESIVGVPPRMLPSVEGHDVRPSDVVEMLKQHLRDDPETALAGLEDKLTVHLKEPA